MMLGILSDDTAAGMISKYIVITVILFGFLGLSERFSSQEDKIKTLIEYNYDHNITVDKQYDYLVKEIRIDRAINDIKAEK